ncbi:MAG: cell wall-binding repeat-containing protein [Actinomycetota bacterium]|jgi:putative cell wall-binding protein
MSTTPRRLLGSAVSCALLTGLLASPASAQDARLANSLDPTIASVDLALETFEPGSVDVLVLGRNDQFADNLGGSALAGQVGGPLLLTDGGPDAALRPEVLDAIGTLVPRTAGLNCDNEPADVYVLGGDNAVSAGAVEELLIDGYCVERLAGDSRVETSVAVAREMRERGAPRAFLLARADSFADSAAAGAYGARFGWPVLLTSQDTLHPASGAYISEDQEPGVVLDVYVWILGGTAAVSQDVEDQVFQQVGPNRVSRVAGATRDETSTLIADAFQAAQEEGNASLAVGLVNGFADDGWVYALIGGAISPVTNAPILYVQADGIGDPVARYLDVQKPSSILVLGPPERVSDATAEEARGIAGVAISKE